jgi:hypothetical protein
MLPFLAVMLPQALVLLSVLCNVVIHAARYQVVGSVNQTQFIQLKSQYDLLPGTSLSLSIDVPAEYIGLFGSLPPRLNAVTSQNPAGIYGMSLHHFSNEEKSISYLNGFNIRYR